MYILCQREKRWEREKNIYIYMYERRGIEAGRVRRTLQLAFVERVASKRGVMSHSAVSLGEIRKGVRERVIGKTAFRSFARRPLCVSRGYFDTPENH